MKAMYPKMKKLAKPAAKSPVGSAMKRIAALPKKKKLSANAYTSAKPRNNVYQKAMARAKMLKK